MTLVVLLIVNWSNHSLLILGDREDTLPLLAMIVLCSTQGASQEMQLYIPSAVLFYLMSHMGKGNKPRVGTNKLFPRHTVPDFQILSELSSTISIMEVLVTEPYSVTSHLLHKLSSSSRQRCSLRTDYSQSAIYMKKTRMAASESLNSIIQLSQYYEERRPLLFTSQSSSPQLTVTSQTPVLDSLLKDTCLSCYVHEEQFFFKLANCM